MTEAYEKTLEIDTGSDTAIVAVAGAITTVTVVGGGQVLHSR